MAKPVVDRLERQLEGEARVIRLNALSGVGREAAARFAVRAVPTLVVLDGCQRELGRQVGIVNPAPVIETVRNHEACAPETGS